MSQTKRIGLVIVPVIIGVVGWLWYQDRDAAEQAAIPQTGSVSEPEQQAEVAPDPAPVAEPVQVVEVPVEQAEDPLVPDEEPPVADDPVAEIQETVVELASEPELAVIPEQVPAVEVPQPEVVEVAEQPTPEEQVELAELEPVAEPVVELPQDTQSAEPVEQAATPAPEEDTTPQPEETTTTPEAPSPEPEAVTAEQQPQPEPEPLPEAEAQPAPEFDLVRVENDGATVIAGRAEPGAQVTVTVDGQAVGTATASSRGEFVAMVDTPQTGVAQEIRLQTGTAEEGNESTSDEAVIVIVDTPTEDEQQADAPVVVLSTPATVEVIQPAISDIAGQIVLDSISYSAEGEVVLSGRGQPGSAARVYANGAPVTEADIRQDGNWSVVVNTIDVGDYTLRVDEVSAEGQVTSRAESPFRRVNPDLAIATLAETGPVQQIVVQPGNNLWTIARERYGRGPLFTQIFTANSDQIRDPDLIYPGQIFSLPEE